MANDVMKKVQELLEMAGLDKEVVKSVTEKLEVEKEAEIQEKCKGETPCETENTEGENTEKGKNTEGENTENGKKEEEDEIKEAKCDGKKVEKEKCDCQKQKKAPTDPEINEEEDEDLDITEALYVLLDNIKEAKEQYEIMENDLSVLKEEYAKLVAEKLIAESMENETSEYEVSEEEVDKRDLIRQIMAIAGKLEDQEDVRTIAKLAEKLAYNGSEAKDGKVDEAEEETEEDDTVEQETEKTTDGEEETKKEVEEKDIKESLDETANKLEKDINSISESHEEVKPNKKLKTYSAFTNLNESVSEQKNTRKAFTLFPNLK